MKFCNIFTVLALTVSITTAVEFSFSDDGATGPEEALVDCNGGEVWVKNYIKYECQAVKGDKSNVVAKAIACSPENDVAGHQILPGSTYSNQHFKWSCSVSGDLMTLKVLNCIDHQNNEVVIGNWFTKSVDSNRTTIECHGDEQSAKKVIFKWTSCVMDNGETIVEGNFRVRYADQLKKAYKNELQIGEIISCKRENGKVSLRCTGCVGENNIHVAIAGYSKLGKQWTQCRRYHEECKLVKVGNHYIDCEVGGKSYAGGEYFNATNGIGSYMCINGFVQKQGCWFKDSFYKIGEVFYEGGEPFVCDTRSESYIGFGQYKGCSGKDQDLVKFGETWREDMIMKRCSWVVDNGAITGPKEEQYACVYQEKVIPFFKIVRDANNNNILKKCALDAQGNLAMRGLTEAENADWLRKKTHNLDLLEYFAKGGQGFAAAHGSHTVEKDVAIEMNTMVKTTSPYDVCEDKLDNCAHLKSLCTNEEDEINEMLQSMTNKIQNLNNIHNITSTITSINLKVKSILQKDQSSCQNKLSILVGLVCPKSCQLCGTAFSEIDLVSKVAQESKC